MIELPSRAIEDSFLSQQRVLSIGLDGIVMNSDGFMMNSVHATVSSLEFSRQEDYVGAVPLMFAAKGGSIEAAELLVSRLIYAAPGPFLLRVGWS